MLRELTVINTQRCDPLPSWRSVVVVVAHPDDESFGLGALLAAFTDAGATVAVMCFTHGEASTVHGVAGELADIRAGELACASEALGAQSVRLLRYPDGSLADVDLDELSALVGEYAQGVRADGMLVFDIDGVTGHPDHVHATAAALAAAERAAIPVLGWTVPSNVAAALAAEYGVAFTGHDLADIDLVISVDRTGQLAAVACHRSQAVPGSLLWRRLELLGDREYLRQIRPLHFHQRNDGTGP